MKGWGILLVLLGVGSFILPAFGMQFRLINAFGGDPSSRGVLFIIVGAVLYLIGKARERGARPAAAPQAPSRLPPAQAPPMRPAPPQVQPVQVAATTGAHFCGSCGAQLARPMKFCTQCGAAIQ